MSDSVGSRLSSQRKISKHKEWRKLCKKRRRQKIRQATARLRDELDLQRQKLFEETPEYKLQLLQKQSELKEFDEEKQEQMRNEANQLWLEREKLAQKEWQQKREAAESALLNKQRQESLIREEWERQKTKEAAEQRAKELRTEERQKQEESWKEQLNSYLNSEDDTIPTFLLRDTGSSARSTSEGCPFFSKTGACRFGEFCSRSHIHPSLSKTIVLPGFYQHYSLSKAHRDEFNSDVYLEFEDSEIYQHFCEFQQDVFGELQSVGTVVQFKVCCNYQPHLRGNVYAQYSSVKEAIRAYLTFQGRWYDGRQLACYFVDIPSWKAAICGLFLKGKCPKGRLCNFLHVFHHPNGMFRQADRDWPNSCHLGETNEQTAPQRQADSRRWRWSESPPPIPSLNKEKETKSSTKVATQSAVVSTPSNSKPVAQSKRSNCSKTSRCSKKRNNR